MPTPVKPKGYDPSEGVAIPPIEIRTVTDPDGTVRYEPVKLETEWRQVGWTDPAPVTREEMEQTLARAMQGYSVPQTYVAGMDPGSNPINPINPIVPGCDCPLCTSMRGASAQTKDPECEGCKKRNEQLDRLREEKQQQRTELTKRIDEAVQNATDEAAKRGAAEERFTEVDKEADNLAAALERVTIERDYLLAIRDWCEAELERAWEAMEEAT